MVKFKILPNKSCLTIIDMTNAFLRSGSQMEVPGGQKLIPKLKRLICVCRDIGIPVIFTKHVFRKDGSDLGLSATFRPELKRTSILREGTPDTEFYKGIYEENNHIVIAKRRFSAFFGTELDLILRCKGIDTLIIAGVATNVCCESTARDARMKDYKVIFLSDGTAAGGFSNMGWGEISPEEVQRNVLTTISCYFGQVLSVEGVMDQLLRLKHRKSLKT